MIHKSWPYILGAPVPKAIQFETVGMSIPGGIGTTGTGSSALGPLNGVNSYPNVAIASLSPLNITPVFRNHPGQLAQWVIDNDLQNCVNFIDKNNYNEWIALIDLGTNDLGSGVTASGLLTKIQTIAAALRAGGWQKIIVCYVMNRKDAVAPSGLANRNAYNTLLTANWSSFADGIVDISAEPLLFADNAPDNATYFKVGDADGSSKLHLTDAGAALYATYLVTAFNSVLLKPTSPVTPIDYAGNFLTATGITDPTISAALRTYVTGLVNNKLHTKFYAIYPIVGGSASTHKFNLLNPVDTDAAYRLTFSGTPTHGANGITWSTTSWGDTHITPKGPSIVLNSNFSLCHYSRNHIVGLAGDIGYRTATPCNLLTNGTYPEMFSGQAGAQTAPATDIGYFTLSRFADMQNAKLYQNGVQFANYNVSVNTGPTFATIWVGGVNNGGANTWGSARNGSFYAVGFGLSAADELIHYNLMKALQNALSR